jgi:hypothetical protein
LQNDRPAHPLGGWLPFGLRSRLDQSFQTGRSADDHHVGGLARPLRSSAGHCIPQLDITISRLVGNPQATGHKYAQKILSAPPRRPTCKISDIELYPITAAILAANGVQETMAKTYFKATDGVRTIFRATEAGRLYRSGVFFPGGAIGFSGKVPSTGSYPAVKITKAEYDTLVRAKVARVIATGKDPKYAESPQDSWVNNASL